MEHPPHDHWEPELDLNGQYICVRYHYGFESVTRHVYLQGGHPFRFTDQREAQAQCDRLNATAGTRTETALPPEDWEVEP
jgi:hypothetical protein